MKKVHPTELTTLIPSEELGRQIMRLRYDLIVPILRGMLSETRSQAVEDHLRGRPKLAGLLDLLSNKLCAVGLTMGTIIVLCQKHIDAEKEEACIESGTKIAGSKTSQ